MAALSKQFAQFVVFLTRFASVAPRNTTIFTSSSVRGTGEKKGTQQQGGL